MSNPIKSGAHRAKLRIATFAVPLSGNKGSASMTIGLVDGLRAENYDVHALIYSYYPKRDSEVAAKMPGVEVRAGHPKHLLFLIPWLMFLKVFRWLMPSGARRAYDELAACDAVCCVGGTTFADSMLYKVPWNVMAALPGLIVGRPVVFLSQTMGPFNKTLNRMAAKWTLSRATAVHGRGERSAENVRKLGIGHAKYWPDLSLSMRLEEAEKSPRLLHWAAQIEERARKAGVKAVGITPNTIVDGKCKSAGIDYRELMVAAMVDLHRRGYPLVLIPHSFRAGTSQGHNNDTQLCRDILSRLPAGVDCLYVEEDLTSQELRVLVSRLEFLLASRFHSMVSALAVGVPPVTFGWGDQKYIEVLEAFGVPELYVDFRHASLEAIRKCVDIVTRDRADLEQRMSAGRKRSLDLAGRLGAELEGLSKGSRSRAPVPGALTEGR